MSHLKRLAAPKTYAILRREKKYTVKSSPGPHSSKSSIPLLVFLRDVIKVVKTSKEAKKILNNRKIEVDGRVITDGKFPIGFMDVVKADKIYRIVFDRKGRIKPIEIDESEANVKISKVIRKQMIKGGRIQVTTEDGRNFLINDDVSVGDSILFSIPNQKVKKILKLEIGKTVMLMAGKYVGKIAKVLEIIPYKRAEDRVVLESNGTKFETLKKYAVVIGEENPIIKVE